MREQLSWRAGLFLSLLLALLSGLWLGSHWLRSHEEQLRGWVRNGWQRALRASPVQRLQRRFPGTWSWLARRLEPGAYLGLHLTVGFLVSIAALALFASIAEDVVGSEDLTQFDLRLATALHYSATPLGIQIFKAITTLGSSPVLGVLGLLVAVMLGLRRRWVLLCGWIIGLGGSTLLTVGLKTVFQRPRPAFTDPFLVEPTWSFPSGHSLGSLLTYGLLAYLCIVSSASATRWRGVIIGLTAALVLAIGLSRMYLGAHYFSDVVAGFAAGAVWLATCVTGLEVARRRSAPTAQHMPPERPGTLTGR